MSAGEIEPSGIRAAAPRPVPYAGYHDGSAAPDGGAYRDLIGQRTWAASARDATRHWMLVLADLAALGIAFVTTGFASAGARLTYQMCRRARRERARRERARRARRARRSRP